MHYQSLWPIQVLQFLPDINQMVQMVLEPFWPQIQMSLFQKLPGISMSNIDFLIANVM